MATPIDHSPPPSTPKYKLVDPSGDYFSPGTKEKYGNPENPTGSSWPFEDNGDKGALMSAIIRSTDTSSAPLSDAPTGPVTEAEQPAQPPKHGIVGRILRRVDRTISTIGGNPKTAAATAIIGSTVAATPLAIPDGAYLLAGEAIKDTAVGNAALHIIGATASEKEPGASFAERVENPELRTPEGKAR